MQRLVLASIVFIVCTSATHAQDRPAQDAPAQLAAIEAEVEKDQLAIISKLETISDSSMEAVDLYSRRGDARMFLGRFDDAVDDYQAMTRLKPELDASHWRLGIALYYAGKPEDAAAQFDRYHSFDQIDRENGIWRYLSHHKAFGREKAREQLLKYDKDDRPPFREVYRLFDGTLSPDEVLKAIPADLSDDARNSRLFYSHLYIGLLHAANDEPEAAAKSLQISTLNPWPHTAGFGPNWMWHVGRLQLRRLDNADAR